jgi:hypothetical protein
MSIRNNVLLVIVAIAALGILYAQYDSRKSHDIINIKLRLKPGESHEIRVTQFQSVSQRWEDKGSDSNQISDIIFVLGVNSVDANGTMNGAITFKSIKLGIETPYGYLEFNPEKPLIKKIDPNNDYQKTFNTLFSVVTGSSLNFRIAPTGEVLNVTGFENILAKFTIKMAKLDAENEPNDQKQKELLEMVRQAMGEHREKMYETFFYEALNETQIGEIADSAIMKFPADFAVVGRKWQYKQRLNLASYPFDVNTVYKIERHNNGIAYIDTISKLDMDKLKNVDITPRENILMKLSGTVNSTAEADEITGLLKKSDAHMKISGILRIEPDRLMLPVRPNMNIQITFDSYTTVELLK